MTLPKLITKAVRGVAANYRREFGARTKEEASRSAHALVAEMVDEKVRAMDIGDAARSYGVPKADMQRFRAELVLIAAWHHKKALGE